VVSALSSYQAVRRRNETKADDHAALRKHMMEAQADPEKIIEGLATNMGFWLLEQVFFGRGGLALVAGRSLERAALFGLSVRSCRVKEAARRAQTWNLVCACVVLCVACFFLRVCTFLLYK
jgi:uncharacterized membrane protein